MDGPHPAGTVTFLFTDIEGSTVMWDHSQPAMTEAVARHDRLITGAIEQRGGYVFASGGDGFAAAFPSASDAAAAAVDAQRKLAAQEWPADARITVRMGLHTGTAHERDGDYFGTVVNRASRIGAAGHGGQVLLSAATAELLADDEWSLVDLGVHHLKGLTRPDHLFQLRAEGMADVELPIRSAGSGVAVRLLGGVEAKVDDRSVTLGGEKQRAILALLATEVGRAVPVERLIDSVWGESPPETVRASLQVQISQLRRAFTDAGFPGAIETRPPGYLLVADREALDLHRFNHYVEQARAAAYSHDIAEAGRLARSALAEFGGTPFAGLRDRASFEAVAVQVEAHRLTMIELAADADLAARKHDAVVAELELVAGDNPYRESLWERLALALYRCGRQADALERLGRLRRGLLEDLGLDPSPSVVALENAILRQDPTLDAQLRAPRPAEQEAPGSRLPASRPVVGRSTLIATATDLLGRERLVTLLGPGGVGKTSIANHVAARRVAEHGDYVCFVDLAVIPTGALVAAAVGTSLGLRADPSGLTTSNVIEFLSARSVLLYLDTCEHVVDSVAEFVDHVLAECPNASVMATSREPLRTRDERVVEVTPLTPDDAAELFAARAGIVGDLADAGYDADVITDICRNVDGLPLAIELVSARARTSAPLELQAQTRALAVLRVDRRDLEARHRTLEATIGWSYDLLDSRLQQLLCRLSVFCGGFTAGAAAVVGSDSDGPGDIVDDLDALVSRSLLTADRLHQRNRFRLLDTVAVFAAKRLADTGEVDSIHRRHLSYMIDWSRATRKELEGPNPAPALVTLVSEEANLRAAYQTCLDVDDPSSLVDIVGALGPFGLGTSGIVPEADEWIEKALAVQDVEPRQRLDVLLLAAWYLDLDKERQVETATEALLLAEDCGDVAAQVFALGCLCVPGDQIEVDAHLQRALTLAAQADRPVYVAWPAEMYLNFLLRRHDTKGAAELLDRLLADGSQQYGFLEGTLLAQRARHTLSIGDFSTAEEQYADAMTAGLRTASPFAVSYAHFGQGELARARGDLDQARRAYERALEIDLRICRREEFLERAILARICARQGDLPAAHEHVRLLEVSFKRSNNPQVVGSVAHVQGVIAEAEGRHVEAITKLVSAAEQFAALHIPSWVAQVVDDLTTVTAIGDDARHRLQEAAAALRAGKMNVSDVLPIVNATTQG
jgi:predicted ATPase/class 3 adenylate cyclase/DNA-binding SARP family transcriptional activator/tetratricopeptide (TPR) repeat protein